MLLADISLCSCFKPMGARGWSEMTQVERLSAMIVAHREGQSNVAVTLQSPGALRTYARVDGNYPPKKCWELPAYCQRSPSIRNGGGCHISFRTKRKSFATQRRVNS